MCTCVCACVFQCVSRWFLGVSKPGSISEMSASCPGNATTLLCLWFFGGGRPLKSGDYCYCHKICLCFLLVQVLSRERLILFSVCWMILYSLSFLFFFILFYFSCGGTFICKKFMDIWLELIKLLWQFYRPKRNTLLVLLQCVFGIQSFNIAVGMFLVVGKVYICIVPCYMPTSCIFIWQYVHKSPSIE